MNFSSIFHLDANQIVMIKVGIRLLLAATLGLASIMCLMGAFEWIFWEENAQKAYEAKEKVGKMLIVITTVFVLLAFFRLWFGSYSTLTPQ